MLDKHPHLQPPEGAPIGALGSEQGGTPANGKGLTAQDITSLVSSLQQALSCLPPDTATTKMDVGAAVDLVAKRFNQEQRARSRSPKGRATEEQEHRKEPPNE